VTATGCQNQLDCVTGTTALVSSLIAEAWDSFPEDAYGNADAVWVQVAEDDLRGQLPAALAALPYDCVVLLSEWVGHVGDLVADYHRIIAMLDRLPPEE
jgi:hypothetical protein